MHYDLTAFIRKGEKQYVAFCPELDVVSQGKTIETALENLKEAVNVFLEEFGVPETFKDKETFVSHFEVESHGKTARAVRA